MERSVRKIAMVTLFLIIIQITLGCVINAQKIETNTKVKYILVVDINGNGDYCSIQNAIDNAEIGSTIYISKGEYKEIIEIKKQINIVGEDKDATLINPISEKNKYAILIGAPSVKIQGLNISNGAPGLYSNGIRITSSNNIIKECNIYNNPIGIAIWSSENRIENCTIWNCKDEAIALLGSQYSECNNNNIIDCEFFNNCDGIELQYSKNNKISNCIIYKNSHSGIDAITESNDNNLISNCEIYKNEVHGIYLSSSSYNKIIDCNIYDNDDGNIIMNIKSINNEIIKTEKIASNLNINEDNNEEKTTIEKIKHFFNIISNIKTNKIGSIFRINNF